jgi:hypothetical protein
MHSDLFKNVNELPTVLVNLIYDFMPKLTSMFLNKKNYIDNHIIFRDYVRKKEDYIRCMVKQDNDFVLKQLLYENWTHWIFNMTLYYYKETVYTNYLSFLSDYSIEHNSNKCYNLIKKTKTKQK